MYTEQMKRKVKNIKKKKDIIILGIETSCDETSVAIVKNGKDILSNVISSQIDIHKRFGGVVPEVASRNHTMAIVEVLNQALDQAKLKITDIDAIGVTYGAGLIGALMVGVSFAKSLSYTNNIPLFAVNHIKGHISAIYTEHKKLQPPFICLLVSGGHTAILEVLSHTKHKLIGETLDDAVGEAYDKVARVLGLGYPGGPVIDRLSKEGNSDIVFRNKDNLVKSSNFSYSGLKTAVINYINMLNQKGSDIPVNDICASFQKDAVDMLIDKTVRATIKSKQNKIVLAGGVAANSYLRENMVKEAEKYNIDVYYPSIRMCTDNAAMIASQAFFDLINGVDVADLSLSPKPSVKL